MRRFTVQLSKKVAYWSLLSVKPFLKEETD